MNKPTPGSVTIQATGASEVEGELAASQASLTVKHEGGGPSAISAKPASPTPAQLATSVVKAAAIAERYAELGLLQLAERRLAVAEDSMSALAAVVPTSAIGPHPGLLPRGHLVARNEAEASLTKARRTLELARTKPVAPLGAPPWEQTVVLFGSSMNPPTGTAGHGGIVTWGARAEVDIADDERPENARQDVPVDKVWVLPVYRHLFASKSNLLPFEQRMEMAKLAFSDLPGLEGRVEVKDTERTVVEKAVAEAKAAGLPLENVRVGTIDILRHLQAEYPKTKFVLALGADTYQDLLDGKWKEGDKILASTPIIVVPREGVSGVTGFADNAPKLGEVSSTKIRSSADLEYLSDPEVLHPKVLEYMQKNKLYGFAEGTGD